jgi:hypothetical protein
VWPAAKPTQHVLGHLDPAEISAVPALKNHLARPDKTAGPRDASQRKAVIEALVAQVKITGPDRIVPVFRIPQAAGRRTFRNQRQSVLCSCNDQFGGAGGIRTHTGRNLNPVPLPLGYGPSAELPWHALVAAVSRCAQIPRSLRSLATCPVAFTA